MVQNYFITISGSLEKEDVESKLDASAMLLGTVANWQSIEEPLLRERRVTLHAVTVRDVTPRVQAERSLSHRDSAACTLFKLIKILFNFKCPRVSESKRSFQRRMLIVLSQGLQKSSWLMEG